MQTKLWDSEIGVSWNFEPRHLESHTYFLHTYLTHIQSEGNFMAWSKLIFKFCWQSATTSSAWEYSNHSTLSECLEQTESLGLGRPMRLRICWLWAGCQNIRCIASLCKHWGKMKIITLQNVRVSKSSWYVQEQKVLLTTLMNPTVIRASC